jgi:hypothetical protein
LDLSANEWAIDHPGTPHAWGITTGHQALDFRVVTINIGFAGF